MKIESCPNPECKGVCAVFDASELEKYRYSVICDDALCGYSGPSAETEAEAIRLHNLICTHPHKEGLCMDCDDNVSNHEQQAVAQLEVRNGIAGLKHLLAPIEQVSDGMMLYRSPVGVTSDFYWCIEWRDQLHVEKGVAYKRTVWCGLRSDAQPTDSMPYIEWVSDTSRAIRFTRKEDAEAVVRLIGLCTPVATLVTQHLDIDRSLMEEVLDDTNKLDRRI